MIVEWANAEYTGGGLYAYIGKLKNGNYFMAADDWNSNKGCFVYEMDSEVVFDTFTEDNPAPWSNEWMDKHTIATHGIEAFKHMLEWIIINEPNGNYSKEELERRFERRS